MSAKPTSAVARSDDGQVARANQLIAGAKGIEDVPTGRARLGYGNAGQGYTFEEVKDDALLLLKTPHKMKRQI
jgi:hypothetical protein